VTAQTVRGQQGVALEQEAVEQISASYAYLANLQVLRTNDRMQGALLTNAPERRLRHGKPARCPCPAGFCMPARRPPASQRAGPVRQALCQPMAKLGADGVGHGDSDRGQRVQAAETVCCRRRARRSHSFSCR
jgi:hypothetical protein